MLLNLWSLTMNRLFRSNSSSDSLSSRVASDTVTSSGMLDMNPGSPGSPGSADGSMQNFAENKSYAIPRLAITSTFKAPVHIDVGGVIYTSSLETLASYPESKLTKMFSGVIPIVFDTLKQHYFIDRDGGMFRHILNFLRNQRLLLPYDFPYLELLLSEAEFFELHEMVYSITLLKNERDECRYESRECPLIYEEEEEDSESRECPFIYEDQYDNESRECPFIYEDQYDNESRECPFIYEEEDDNESQE